MSYRGPARREREKDGCTVPVESCSADTRAVGWNNFNHTTARAGDEAGDQGPPEVGANAWSKRSKCPSPARMSPCRPAWGVAVAAERAVAVLPGCLTALTRGSGGRLWSY